MMEKLCLPTTIISLLLQILLLSTKYLIKGYFRKASFSQEYMSKQIKTPSNYLYDVEILILISILVISLSIVMPKINQLIDFIIRYEIIHKSG